MTYNIREVLTAAVFVVLMLLIFCISIVFSW